MCVHALLFISRRANVLVDGCVGKQRKCVCVPTCKCIECIGERININHFRMQVKDLGVSRRLKA